jgi:hypothetical protein
MTEHWSRYIHCRMCMEKIPRGMSAEKHARLAVSIEPGGLQIVCVRHKKLVAFLTLDKLAQLINEVPECEFCKRGIPHEHFHER